MASPTSALRDYNSGRYSLALKEYEKLLQRNADDPRLHFNAGAAAYRDEKFDEAAKQFDRALDSPDLKLQQSAYYNRGNTFYRLGEKGLEPNKKQESWEKSLKDYESALKLNQQDPDAKHNYEFVKQQLEELKQQQQQQQQQDKSDDQKKQDQQQQQQQNQQNQQSKNDQNKQQQQQSQQNQSDQKQDQQKQQGQQKQDQQQQQDKDKQKQQGQQQQAQAGQQDDKSEPKEGEEAQAYAGQMTPAQAKQLLDGQKGEERMMPVRPEGKPVDSTRPFKDW